MNRAQDQDGTYLHVEDVSKAFGGQHVLDRVGFSAGDSDFVCLLGPSGCGKTTLLRIIAGLLECDAGRIRLGERDVTALPPQARGFGIVFQSYSLFPNMTAAQNIGYGMRLRATPARVIQQRTRELLELVQLPEAGDKLPAALSGGQQQRIALARALAVEPSLLLLDEPLSALDARVRQQLRGELRQVQRSLGIPTVMVTHDQQEALSMADLVVCLNAGRVEQAGTPQQVYRQPRTRFAAQLVGDANLIETEWVRQVWPELLATRPEGADAAYFACIRPEDLLIETAPAGDARVVATRYLGNVFRQDVAWRGRTLQCERHADQAPPTGAACTLSLRPGHCWWVAA
ncbi:ABC transporter ATP-binding protein [Xanthomonas massiliensis]|uniref:ABC transporter ATP-binding protein n=1 Tax=Xanthomonas massiliensis TaxID=1720302 RepID=UPI000824866D|nr:ATP-binding cassette domain-containing protein [Xanthomonas massiliensis]